MRDSRLGSYGAIALVLALTLRVTSLAALTERGLGLAIFALICAGAVSRTAGLLPLLLSAPARRDGAGAAMSRPTGDAPVSRSSSPARRRRHFYSRDFP